MTTFAHIGGGIAVAATIQHFVFKEEIAPSTILVGAFLGYCQISIPSLHYCLVNGPLGHKCSLIIVILPTRPYFYLLVSGIIWLVVDWKWALLFLAVTLTHLMMDSWSTDDGIMWLWPLSSNNTVSFRWMRMLGEFMVFNFMPDTSEPHG